jgi:hypothetical protein
MKLISTLQPVADQLVQEFNLIPAARKQQLLLLTAFIKEKQEAQAPYC